MTSLLILCSLAAAADATIQVSAAKPSVATLRPQISPAAAEDPVDKDLAHKLVTRVGTRYALILCGHPGTDVYRQAYRQSAEKIRDALRSRWGFPTEHVWVRYGAKSHSEDAPGRDGCRGPATRKAIAADVAQLGRSLTPRDTLWVVVIGHSHFDGRHVLLNLPGLDINQSDFGKLFKNLKCREQVFFITVPASGFFIADLSAKSRVVITATVADAETNESRFHRHLASVLDDPPATAEFDRDRDGRLTLLDLYLTVVRRVIAEYHDAELIPTEHALLDDNGDGRGTELQLDDLEPELGGRAFRRPWRVVIRPPGDGALAAKILVAGQGLNRGEKRLKETESDADSKKEPAKAGK